jgi:MOSC domain-containing protein YiiM
MHIGHVNLGTSKPLSIEGRRILSAIGKQPVAGPVAVGRLGLAGDDQADPTVHGGLSKAVYAYPSEHMPFWRTLRRQHGVSLFDEALPPGFVGENLSLHGLLEADVWVGDTLHFAHCVLRVTEPRQPCFKFNAVMGFNQAGKAMAQSGFCGFYLAVDQPGTLQAGETFTLAPGQRALGIAQAFAGKRWKHLR